MISIVVLNENLEIRSEYARLQRPYKTHLRPQISEPTPQKTAPTRRPMFYWLCDRKDEKHSNQEIIDQPTWAWSALTGTCLTELEEGSFKRKFIDNGAENQASGDLRQVGPRSRLGYWVLTGHRLSANHPKPVTKKSHHCRRRISRNPSASRAEDGPDTYPCRSPGWRCSGVLLWHGTHGQDQKCRLWRRCRLRPRER